MTSEQPDLPGVEVVDVPVHRDHRGEFSTSYSLSGPEGAAARFPIAQVSRSRSHQGVLRGIHFTLTPPGCAKVVKCSSGSARDIVVDLRRGSPTFGRVAEFELAAEDARVLMLPVGVGHGFHATSADTVIDYLLSTAYQPANELALDWTDPELGPRLVRPEGSVVSGRDLRAPSLAELMESGALPDYGLARELDSQLLEDLRAQGCRASKATGVSGTLPSAPTTSDNPAK